MHFFVNFFIHTAIVIVISTASTPFILPSEEAWENNDEYCTTGPPGRYCLKDLSGYYDCRIDPKTGTYIDKTNKCQGAKRCGCFYGPMCPSKMADPCVPYSVPPKFPESYLMTYTGEKQTCSPIGCVTNTFSGIRYQDTKNNGRFREDIMGINGMETTVFIFANSAQYDIDWESRRCSKTIAPPLGPFQIPEFYTQDGKELVNGVNADRWHWFQGAHNAGEGYQSTYIYATQTPSRSYVPVKMFSSSDFGPPVKESFWRNETTGEFKSAKLNDTYFRVPSFCKLF